MAARALLTDADAGMYARYSFIVYTQAVQGVGAAHQIVPDRDFDEIVAILVEEELGGKARE